MYLTPWQHLTWLDLKIYVIIPLEDAEEVRSKSCLMAAYWMFQDRQKRANHLFSSQRCLDLNPSLTSQ